VNEWPQQIGTPQAEPLKGYHQKQQTNCICNWTFLQSLKYVFSICIQDILPTAWREHRNRAVVIK
jgi:hypothetical protein